MPEFTEKQAERYIRRFLREQNWTSVAIESTVRALQSMDGLWSYGTARMVKDLEQLYAEMIADHGEPPDRDW